MTAAAKILYCGDTTLDTAACYLAGVLTHAGLDFEYRRSDEAVTEDDLSERRLVILSDYPAEQMPTTVQTRLRSEVENGTSLLMIGGWESFHGLGGDWDNTPIAEALPIVIQTEDDRLNCDHPVLLRRTASHPITDGLPFVERPPVIGGFNRFTPKSNGEVLLEADRLRCEHTADGWQTERIETHPLLVVGQHGRGKTAAIATDAAPHWVGGFVDWGDGRVRATAPDAEPIEVGDLYARFWQRLVAFLLL